MYVTRPISVLVTQLIYFQLYTIILGALTLWTRARVATIASAHATTILLLTLGVFLYRDVVPLGTFTKSPMDGADGWITWLRIGLLGFSGVLVPLCLPGTFKPLDPSVSLPSLYQ